MTRRRRARRPLALLAVAVAVEAVVMVAALGCAVRNPMRTRGPEPTPAEVKRDAARERTRAAERAAESGDTAAAMRLAFACIEQYPDEPASESAVRFILRTANRSEDTEGRRDIVARLDLLARRFVSEEVADNLLHAAAELQRDADPVGAVARWDELWLRFPRSSLADDACFAAAQLLRARGDFAGALLRLRRIVAERRPALLVGSYNPLLLDDAQLAIGRLLLDDLHDPRQAAAAFTVLADEFDDSLLRDDALFELHRSFLAVHSPPGDEDRRLACAALARLLARFPDGNRARAARERQGELGCAPFR